MPFRAEESAFIRTNSGFLLDNARRNDNMVSAGAGKNSPAPPNPSHLVIPNPL